MIAVERESGAKVLLQPLQPSIHPQPIIATQLPSHKHVCVCHSDRQTATAKISGDLTRTSAAEFSFSSGYQVYQHLKEPRQP